MSNENRSGLRARREILDAALDRFSNDGYAGTSVQLVADDSGHSKSSVLYHFASKEQMLDAALTPALNALEVLLDQLPVVSQNPGKSADLLEQFVDFLLHFRREAAIVLIQGRSLGEMLIMQRANALVSQLAEGITSATADFELRMRIGVGLAGAAYVLATGDSYLSSPQTQPDDDVRAALVSILADLFFTEH